MMVTRRLFEIGGRQPRSLGVVLPKEWLRFWGLHKGEDVLVLGNSVLVVIPAEHPKRAELEASVKARLVDGSL